MSISSEPMLIHLSNEIKYLMDRSVSPDDPTMIDLITTRNILARNQLITNSEQSMDRVLEGTLTHLATKLPTELELSFSNLENKIARLSTNNRLSNESISS